MFASSLLVVHYTGRCSEDDVSKLTRRQKLDNPLLEIRDSHVVARANDAGLVDTEGWGLAASSRLAWRRFVPAIELDDDLARAVVIDLFKLSYVSCGRTESVMSRSIKRWTSQEGSENV